MLPNKPFNQEIPKSMQNSGTELDSGCGNIEYAEAGMDASKGLDFKPAVNLSNKKGEKQ